MRDEDLEPECFIDQTTSKEEAMFEIIEAALKLVQDEMTFLEGISSLERFSAWQCRGPLKKIKETLKEVYAL